MTNKTTWSYTPLLQRFWEKIDRTETCWNWTGNKNDKGYGHCYFRGKDVPAHRIAWEIEFGVIPEGLHVLHHCDNPGCVNPFHLFLGTNRDNVDDKVRKGRQSRLCGEACGASRCTWEEVREIRRLYACKWSARALGRKFGIAHGTVLRIVKGQTWKVESCSAQ